VPRPLAHERIDAQQRPQVHSIDRPVEDREAALDIEHLLHQFGRGRHQGWVVRGG
jgi:hypothetical protein